MIYFFYLDVVWVLVLLGITMSDYIGVDYKWIELSVYLMALLLLYFMGDKLL